MNRRYALTLLSALVGICGKAMGVRAETLTFDTKIGSTMLASITKEGTFILDFDVIKQIEVRSGTLTKTISAKELFDAL